MDIIGQRLRGLRMEMNLSQAKVAEMIGTSQSNINKYETNKTSPPPATLRWYADYFHVSLDYIFGRTDDPLDVRHDHMLPVHPESFPISEDIRQFVNMCFNPDHPMNYRMKTLMMRMFTELKRM